ELFERYWPRKNITLRHCRAVFGREPEVFGRFDTFYDRFEPQFVRKSERQAKDRLLFAVFRNTRHERAIDLHGVEGEPRHRRKIRIAGSEIVHCKAYAQLPEQAYSLA